MDWMTVLVRFALYVVLMLVFGLPLFQLHALRKPERSSVLAKKFSNLAVAGCGRNLLIDHQHGTDGQGDERGRRHQCD